MFTEGRCAVEVSRDPLMEALTTYYQEHFPELFNTKSVVAISGGLDSTVLLRSLVEAGVDVVGAHVNYGLRAEESDADEAFVRELCEELGVPIHVKNIDLKKGTGLQARAREVRYEWFDEVVQNENADLVLTAHHADDQVETIYFRLTRGAGMDGLAGIPVKRDNIVRPLLGMTRDQIRAYADERSWAWREDRSNLSNDYLRNKIRNQVLPELEREEPGIRSEILELGFLATTLVEENKRSFEEFSIDHIATEGSIERVDLAALMGGYDVDDILYRWLMPKGFTAGTIRRIGESLDASTGSEFPGPEGTVLKDRGALVYRSGGSEAVEVTIDRDDEAVKTSIGNLMLQYVSSPQEFNNDPTEILVDHNKLQWPLVLRNWREGDRMTVLGMQGTKKVSDILVDDKVSRVDKDRVLVLESGGELVWLVGLRQSELHKVTSKTKGVMQIKYLK